MKPIKNILILRFRRIGDAVISTVLCTSLKNTFPEAQIHYVLNENIVSLFEHHPDIDKIIPITKEDTSSFWGYIKKVRQIVRETKYDVILDTRSTLRSLWFPIFSFSSPYKIGKKKGYSMLFHRYNIDMNGKIDEALANLKLLSPLEKKYDIQYDSAFKLYATEEEKTNSGQKWN